MQTLFGSLGRRLTALAVVALALSYFVHPLAGLLALPIVGMADNTLSADSIRQLIAWGYLGTAGGFRHQNQFGGSADKTANYTVDVTLDPCGTLFTNRGAGGAVTFTLPAVTPALRGYYYRFRGVADQTFTVTAAAAAAVCFNNAAATSLACSTGGQKIGAQIEAECDGTKWHLKGHTIGVAYTVA